MGFITFGPMDHATLKGEAATKVEVIAELAELGSRSGELGVKKGHYRLKRGGVAGAEKPKSCRLCADAQDTQKKKRLEKKDPSQKPGKHISDFIFIVRTILYSYHWAIRI